MRVILWVLRRYAVALGVLALAGGLGLLVEGDVLVGTLLVAAGIPLFVVPLVAMVRQLRSAGFDGAKLGWSRSPAAADPATMRRLAGLGGLLLAVLVQLAAECVPLVERRGELDIKLVAPLLGAR